MKFGRIDNVLLIGGGEVMADLAIYCKKQSILVSVLVAPRHHDEYIPSYGLSLHKIMEVNGINVLNVEDVNNDKRVAAYVSDHTLGISIGPPWIFKKHILALFNGRLVNFHGIPLPKYRGGAHFTWQILQQNRSGGLFIQLIDEKLDAGEVVISSNYQISPQARKPADYFNESNLAASKFLQRFLQLVFQEEDFQLSLLQEEFSLYMPRLSTINQAFIDWSWSSDDILRFIDAFDAPYPGASTFLLGKRVFLKECDLDFNDGAFHPFQFGLVIRRSDNDLFIATESGTLVISDITYEDDSDAFPDARLGERLYTPSDVIDSMYMYKAEYTSLGLS